MTQRSSIRSTGMSLLLATLLLTACGGDSPEKLMSSARDYLRKHDAKAAAIQIKSALQKNPDSIDARFLLGKALFESGDPVGAEVELRRALESGYAEDEVVPLIARALLVKGQAKDLINAYAKKQLKSPEAQADLVASLAAAHAAVGDLAAAESAVNAGLKASPQYVPLLIMQARLKGVAKDTDGAQAILDGVLKREPTNFEALKLRGDLYAVVDKGDDALAAYTQSVAAKSDYLPAHNSLVAGLLAKGRLDDAGKALEALKKVAPKHPQTLLLATRFALAKKDLPAARENVQQLLKVAPQSPVSLMMAGLVELQLRSLNQAETYLVQAIQIDPQLGGARRILTEVYLRSGQNDKAQATVEPLLANGQNDAGLLELAGRVYLQSGDPKRAEIYLTKASKLDPNDNAKRTAVAMSHLAQGRSDAVGELEQISASDKGTSADMALITSLLRQERVDEALVAIAALEKKLPDSPMVANLHGQTELVKKNVEAARKSFEHAVALSPTFFPAVASLAALDLVDKKPDDARKRFEAVLAKDPKNMQALLSLAELRLRAGEKPLDVVDSVAKAVTANPTEPAPRLALIDLYMRGGDFKKALSVAQDAVAALPDKPEILDALGRAQAASGDSNQALVTFNRLSTLQPKSPQPYLRIADLKLAAKDTPAAIAALKRALDVSPESADAQRKLASLYVATGKTTEAKAIARTMQKQRPKDPLGYGLEGEIATASKSWPEAIAAYRNGLKVVQSPALAIKLHSALVASGAKAEADKFAAGWLKDFPSGPEFNMYMGDAATAAKDFTSASKYYQAALKALPDNAMALNNLAWTSQQLKDPKALEYAEKANALAPNQPAMMDTLAMILAEQGKTDRSLALLTKAVELAPKAADVRLNLAKVLIGTGKKNEAKVQLDELAKLGDKYPRQSEVAQLQKSL